MKTLNKFSAGIKSELIALLGARDFEGCFSLARENDLGAIPLDELGAIALDALPEFFRLNGALYTYSHYTDQLPEKGDRISLNWCTLVSFIDGAPSRADFYEFPYCVAGDYVGSSLGEANRRAILKEFDGQLSELIGSYSATSVCVRVADLTLDMIERILPLQDYSVLSGVEYYEIETEWENEAFESTIKGDLRSELIERFPTLEDLIEDSSDGALYNLLNRLSEVSNTYWENNYNTMHISAGKLASYATVKMIREELAPALTPVVFRKWKESGSLIALFPGIPATINAQYCETFEHVGQHSAGDYYGLIDQTYPANPDEFEELKKELESAPYSYNLKPVKRATSKMHEARRIEAKKQGG